jgi:hypothetical protein
MLEFIRHLVAGGAEDAAMRMTAMRVTVGTPVTVSWVRQNFAGLMAGTAAVSPSLALD